MSQGHFQVDDNELKDAGIARIYESSSRRATR